MIEGESNNQVIAAAVRALGRRGDRATLAYLKEALIRYTRNMPDDPTAPYVLSALRKSVGDLTVKHPE